MLRPQRLLSLAFLLSALCLGADRNWPTYLGDNTSSQYSSLTQITPSNVAQLEVAWTFDASQFPTKNRFLLECNPLIIDGTFYGTGGNKMLFALDAATGELIWRFDPYEIEHGDNAPNVNRTWANRGVHYWSDGKSGRIIYSSQHLLCAVNAETGQLIPSFGNKGVVDLRKGLGREVDDLAYAPTTPGVVFENLLILGSRVTEALPASPGHIRAFDIRTGEQVWRFNTIPHPGEFGYDTWPEDAYLRAGGANTWTGMALDEERGLVYCPTGSPSFDYYGGDRVGQNLFGNSLLCLDVRTGERKWHFQAIHHDIFDMDLPSPPNLFTMQRDGKEIPAVSLLTKQGYVYVFNRVTGEPLFPIEEVPVPASDLPGESAWPTQPRPLKPTPYSRVEFPITEINDVLPESKKEILAKYQSVEPHVPFLPLSDQRDTIIFPGVWGGVEWGGAAMDPDGILYFNAHDMPALNTLMDTSAHSLGEAIYNRNCLHCHAADLQGGEAFGQIVPNLMGVASRLKPQEIAQIIRDGKGTMPPFAHLAGNETNHLIKFLRESEEFDAYPNFSDKGTEPLMPYTHTGNKMWKDSRGYPAIKPPWGTLNALDLSTGEYLWQTVFGEFPELIEKGIEPTGRISFGGPVVTASGLLFIGASLDGYIRAYDVKTGEELWRDRLPFGGQATPSIYEVDGKQYIVIGCGGGRSVPSGDMYVAYALP